MTVQILTKHHLEFLNLNGGCAGLVEKRELVALLILSSWCLVMDVWLFLAVPWVCLRCVIVVFPDHTHLLFLPGVYSCQNATLLEITCCGSIVVYLLISHCHGYRGFSHNVKSFFSSFTKLLLI